MPVIFIGIGIVVLFVFVNPSYKDISLLRAQVASYDQALNNSKALENERDKLTAKYNSIDPENLTKLQKFLPENIDNIRLILEIEQIAAPYSMVLKDVKYNTNADAEKTAATVSGGLQVNRVAQTVSKDYGVWNLEFSTVGSYNNFMNFTRDLEKNLRIVDVSSIVFSSVNATGPNASAPVDTYKYNFKIKTYWLKN